MDTLLYVGLGNALVATVLALVAAALSRVLRTRPALVHSLWLLVLLKLLTPPLLSPPLPWSRPATPAPAAVAGPEEAPASLPEADPGPAVPPLADNLPAVLPEGSELASAGPPEQAAVGPAPPAERTSSPTPGLLLPPWQPVVLALWLAGSLLCWAVACLRVYRFERALRHARPAPAAVEEAVRRLAGRLGLARPPAVRFVTAPVPPLLWAVAGPARVLLPAGLWDRLTAEQQETLLTHELAHLRRRDHWVRRLELAALGLYWWLPVVWWARREIQEAEEQCCDAWVVAVLPGAARAYARALLQTLTFLSDTRSALPAGASGIGQVPLLKRRLAMILQGTTPGRLSRPGLLAVLGLAAVLLPLLPNWGQTQTPPPRGTTSHEPVPDDAPPAPTGGISRPAVAGDEPVTRPPVAAAAEPAAGADTARDEIELLEAQLDAKKADVEETQALLQQARRQQARQEELAKRGAIGVEDLDQTRTQAAVLEARLRGKVAQVRETEVRLKQAQRRLNQPSPTLVPDKPAPQFFRSSNQPAPASAKPLAPLPAATPADPKATTIPTLPSRPGADSEHRLRELEKKLDALLQEVEALRREMRPARPVKPATRPPGGSLPPSGTPVEVTPPATTAPPGEEPSPPPTAKPGKSPPAVPSTPPASPPVSSSRSGLGT